ncbi:MAG TPA: BglII/BstYI family type II restriction endonuclease, partial [Solirubrobacteraceae bacterium]|nr:BglII/BstYI family type II restriction endonuclease [Solirubrobacteraceae bacterium]
MDLTDSYTRVFPKDVLARYEWREVRNASAVIANTNPQECKELIAVLRGFSLDKADIVTPGKNEGSIAKKLNKAFRDQGWREGRYDARLISVLTLVPYKAAGEKEKTISETEVLSEGYKVDNLKDKLALDVEWNAKDGNLDRDVSAYRALYEAGIISAGVM